MNKLKFENKTIKEFKCERCIAHIRYINGKTGKVSCPLCKKAYLIDSLEIIIPIKENYIN